MNEPNDLNARVTAGEHSWTKKSRTRFGWVSDNPKSMEIRWSWEEIEGFARSIGKELKGA